MHGGTCHWRHSSRPPNFKAPKPLLIYRNPGPDYVRPLSLVTGEKVKGKRDLLLSIPDSRGTNVNYAKFGMF